MKKWIALGLITASLALGACQDRNAGNQGAPGGPPGGGPANPPGGGPANPPGGGPGGR
ncbi:Adenylate cyclase [Candidatus Methylocalor cossyra]|uniref:Adenylate cyclase n=1 Tax=Candidatus Methylocalor cossyra TaxID=3108543 RepID=A0ABM9NJE8_9GAMM